MPSFFERVYHIVRMIPRGHVSTYGEIAAIISHAGAARTVGWALRALTEGTDVPWHRVVSAQGRISTSSDERGFNVQRLLLEEEGVTFDARGQLDLETHQWDGPTWPEIDALRREWQGSS